MSTEDTSTVYVRGENLDLEISPESEAGWRRAVEIVRIAASADGVEISTGDSGEQPDADFFVGEVENLRSQLDSLENQLDQVTDNFVSEQELGYKFEELQEDLEESESPEADRLAEMQASIDRLESKVEEMQSVDEQSEESSQEDTSEESDKESTENDSGNGFDEEKKEMSVDDLSKNGLVDVGSDYSHDEFKNLSDTEQEVAVYEAVKEKQPAKKQEVADQLYQIAIEDSNSKEAQYVGSVLERMDESLDDDRREVKKGRNPTVYAESGYFDSSEETDSDDDLEEDERNTVEEQNVEEEEEDESVSIDDIEWVGIREAVNQYKNDQSLSYLINRESRKSFKSITTPQALASTKDDMQDWAAVEELPEEFKG